MPAQESTARSLLGAGLGLIGFCAIAGLLVTVMVAPAIAVTGMTASNSLGVFQDLPDYIDLGAASAQHLRRGRRRRQRDSRSPTSSTRTARRSPSTRWTRTCAWAAIDGEDRRFYEHGGVDVPSVIRAAIGQVTGTSESGASTLSMQLVRNILILRAVNTPDHGEVHRRGLQGGPPRGDLPRPESQAQGDEARDRSGEEVHQGRDPRRVPQHRAAWAAPPTASRRARSATSASRRATSPPPRPRAWWRSCRTRARTGSTRPTTSPRNKERRDVILGWMHTQKHLTDEEYQTAIDTPVDETTVFQNAPRSGCTSAAPEYRIPCDFALKTILNGEVSALGTGKAEQIDRWKKGGLQGLPHHRPGSSEPRAQRRRAVRPADRDAHAARLVGDERRGGHRAHPGDGAEQDLRRDRRRAIRRRPRPSTSRATRTTVVSTGAQPGSTYKPFVLLAFLAAGHGAMETFNASIRSMPFDRVPRHLHARTARGTAPSRTPTRTTRARRASTTRCAAPRSR